jgi:hypothetical protein
METKSSDMAKNNRLRLKDARNRQARLTGGEQSKEFAGVAALHTVSDL